MKRTLLERIKSISIILLAVVITIGVTQHLYVKKEANGRIVELEEENKVFEKVIVRQDSTISSLKVDSAKNEVVYDSIKEVSDSLEANEEWFKSEYWRMKAEIASITADSSYKWLQEIGYPIGRNYKPYGFNETQVKAIHLDKVDYELKKGLVSNLELQVSNLEKADSTSREQAETFYGMYESEKEKSESYKGIAENNKEAAEIYKEEAEGQKKAVRLWKGVAIGVTVVELILFTVLK